MAIRQKALILGIFLLAILSLKSNALVINEIMPNTEDDTYNEWVELYNDQDVEVDVSNCTMGDDNSNDTLIGGLYDGKGTTIPAKSYAIITDEATRVYNNFDTSPYAVRLYVDDSSIGNGLKNSGDTIYLYCQNRLIHYASYSHTVKGKSNALLNSIWYIADPTPGYENNGSIIYATEGCDWSVEILSNEVFAFGDEFTFRIKASKLFGNSTKLTGTARIEDLFGNTVKSYSLWSDEESTRQKTSNTYTPNLEDGRSYMIKTEISVGCEETSKNNNYAERLVAMKGSPITEESSIQIREIYDLGSDGKAKFGQDIRVKLEVYKGKTAKESISLWVANGERISKRSKSNVETKNRNYALTVPIQLYPNCDNTYEEGTYTIYAEGLDTEDTEEIYVEGITKNLCNQKNQQETSYELGKTEQKANITANKTPELLPIIESSSARILKTPVTIYESKTIKARKLALYLILTFAILLDIILLVKK